MQKMQVRSLGWEDPLEKEMTIHSSILAWEILWRKEPGELQSMVSQRVSHDSVTEHQQCVMICQVLLLSVDNPQTDRDDYRKGFLLEEYLIGGLRIDRLAVASLYREREKVGIREFHVLKTCSYAVGGKSK